MCGFCRNFAAAKHQKMNLYIRFFNDETLVSNMADAVEFLSQVTNGQVEPSIYQQLEEYYNSTMPYPKRFKVRTRTYFIVIKTTANTMEQFKARTAQTPAMQENGGGAEKMLAQACGDDTPQVADADNAKQAVDELRPGWYEVEITFKRVVFSPSRGKNKYVDATFAAKLKAHSVRESYDMVCQYLKNREDVDNRSQMPSIKGRNFQCKYLGMQAD